MKKHRFIFILLPLFAVASLAFSDSQFIVSKNFDILSAIYKDINQYYVDDVEPSKLMRTFLEGMLKTLDPFTNYFSGSQIEKARIQQEGKHGGIGIEFALMNNYPVVTEVTRNLPADKAGVRTGDVIKAIDGKTTFAKSYDDVLQALVGQPNTTLALQLERNISEQDMNVINLQVKRETVQETNVPFFGMVSSDIGCIRLKIFNPDAGKDVKAAFDSLKNDHPEMKGLILDLRGNPGGLLTEAVNIVNLFVPKGTLVVTTKGKAKEWNTRYAALNDPSDLKIPVVVLVDSKSASASEIVSGSLQDLDRGVVMGQQSYGKGLVQITRMLDYNTMLKVTCAKYYIPSGRCVQALNYGQTNEDGSAKRVPDSLRTSFKTTGGRTVKDGGGVDPDVVIEKPQPSSLATELTAKNILFNYATRYKLNHPAIADVANFSLTDADYADFVAYAKNQSFDHKNETERVLEQLKEASKNESYFDALKDHYEVMKNKLVRTKEQDLLQHKTEIKRLLESEIAGRYHYAYGKIKKSYQTDPEIEAAVSLLHDSKKYSSLLTASK